MASCTFSTKEVFISYTRSNIESIMRLLGESNGEGNVMDFASTLIEQLLHLLSVGSSIYAVNDYITYLLLSAYENITSVSQSSKHQISPI